MDSAVVDYENFTELFCLQSSRNHFVDALVNSDFENNIQAKNKINITGDETIHEPLKYNNEDMVKELYDTIHELNQLDGELKAMDSSSSSNALTLNETMNEINRLQKVLENIENEENVINENIEERLQYKTLFLAEQEILVAKTKSTLPLQVQVNETMNVPAATNDSTSMNTAEQSSTEAESYNQEPSTSVAERAKELDNLLEALKALMGFESFHVEKQTTDDQVVILLIKICFSGNVGSATIEMDSNFKITGVQIDGNTGAANVTDDEASILQECQSTDNNNNNNTAQDLRYVVFACQAALRSQSCLTQDIGVLKQRAIVTRMKNPFSATNATAGGNVDQRRLTVLTIEGITIQIATHYCYPQLPHTAWIEKISGNNIKQQERLDMIHTAAKTTQCFSNIIDLYDFVVNYSK